MKTVHERDINQYCCDNCGETLTLLRGSARANALETKENDMCRQCLTGTMLKILE